MLKVKRSNVVLRIPDTDKQHYLDKGYDVIGDNGQVIESNKPKDTKALEKENAELKALVEKLKADLQAASKQAEVEEAEVVEDVPEEDVKPKNKSKRK